MIAAIPQPDASDYAIISVAWPARPWMRASLLLALDERSHHTMRVLSEWCTQGARVVLVSLGNGFIEMRRRQSLERLKVLLVAEDRLSLP